MSNLRVAYVINDAAFFVSHRMPLALNVLKIGGKVCVITGFNLNQEIEKEAIESLKKNNIPLYKFKFSQGISNPIFEIIGLLQLVFFLKSFKPTTIHSATAKGNLMASIACNFISQSKLIMAISGLGTMFVGRIGFKKLVFQFMYKLFVRLSLKRINYEMIFQNKNDYENYKSIFHFKESEAKLIYGSGVDTENLVPFLQSTNKRKILLPARMLYEKGIEEFVLASRFLKEKNIKGEFYIAGDTVSVNPSAISKEKIKEWVKEGLIIYLGHQNDIKKMYQDMSIVCLPSWREGFPKVLMEAASLGLPVITTDVPGCKDAVIENKTGLIVPVRDHIKLAEAIKVLFENPKLRKKMGKENRVLAEKKFDLNIIVPQIINLYI